MDSFIPYGCQDISQADVDAVTDVLRSAFLTQGPVVPKFEQALADMCSAKHAVAVNSATSALHVACMALGLGPGDALWTSPISFVASANCARYCGATVDFVDIDPETACMSPLALERKLKEAAASGSLPKIVVPVHFGGQPADMMEISQLGKEYGFQIVEDASHAVGASYRGSSIGDGSYAQITVFSFHPVKIITSAEGGMACTNDPVLAEKMRRLRSHGITREKRVMSDPKHGPWYYEQLELGYNYRLTDLQAALGLSQLERLGAFLDARRAVVAKYRQLLPDWTVPLEQKSDRTSAWHLFVVRVGAEKREALFQSLRDARIGVNVHYIPIHLQPYYKALGFRPGDFPESEKYYSRAITLPLHPRLTDDDLERVLGVLHGRVESGGRQVVG